MRRPRHLRRGNLGFLLAKAMQRWNEMLRDGFKREGFAHVRPSFGSVLVPLFEADGLRIGDLARRSGLTKQTMTTMVRAVEGAGLVRQRADPQDRRAIRVWLTGEAHRFRPAAERVLEKIEKIAAQGTAGADLAAARRWLSTFSESLKPRVP